MSHVIILPYFSQIEVERYRKIVRQIADFKEEAGDKHPEFRFLLAASPRKEIDWELDEICREIAPTVSFNCPTQIFGYPAGPSAMFWDAMDYIDQQWGSEPGFSLWMESDMFPADTHWLGSLAQEWNSCEAPLLMGCYVPPVYKRRLLRKWKFMLDEHINGGACYAKNLGSRLPKKAREGVFDMEVFPAASEIGSVIKTTQIAFSTLTTARRDMMDPAKVLLHGFMQDKDRFVNKCALPITNRERSISKFHPALDQMDHFKRSCKVWLLKFGYEAMFENMMLTKRKVDNSKNAA